MLWEIELLADKISDGGLIFIRTNKGWRVFFGNFKEDFRKKLEKTLDENVPGVRLYYRSTDNGEIMREPNMIVELQGFTPDCMTVIPGYIPMKFVNELLGRK